MFDFPLNPASGTVVMVPDGSYRVWDSTKWRASPSSSTITTGPFLPIAGGVMTGALSLSGNATSALHAVPLQQLNAATAGGPFLPLATGGTVAAPVNVSAKLQAPIFETYDYAGQNLGGGGTLKTALGIYGALSGTMTAGNPYFARINLISDTLAAGSGGLTTLMIDQQSGGTGTTGNRVGAYINFNFAGGTTNKSLGYGSQYGGLWSYATASGNLGGTAGAGNAYGTLWGGISSATLASGATFWNASIGHEVNMGVSAGASAAYTQGLKVVLGHHAQAVNPTDYMLGLAKAYLTDTPIANGFMFGSPDGYWPIDASGTLIGALASLLPTPPARTATYGVDFSAITFSGAAFRSTGFSVNGSGTVQGTSINASAGLHCGSTVAGATNDFSKHLDLYGGQAGITVTSDTNLNYTGFGSGSHVFIVGSTPACYISGGNLNFVTGSIIASTAMQCGGPSGPTWTTGSGVPSSTQPVGSIYSRVSTWAAGATLYVSKGSGAWTPVASV